MKELKISNKELIINKLNQDNELYGSNLVLVDYPEEMDDIPQSILSQYLDEIYADSNKFKINANNKEYDFSVFAFEDEIEIRINL